MDLLQNIIEALDSLASNKLRSALTVLGIVIGVGAVIAIVAIGHGAQNSITGSISSIGTNLLFVIPGGGRDVRNPKPLTLEDATALKDPMAAPDIIDAQPLISSRATVAYGGESTTTQISAVMTGYDLMRSLSVTEGEFITNDQVLGRAAVAVLGPTTADNLLGAHEGVTGQTVRISGQPFRVVGVLKVAGWFRVLEPGRSDHRPIDDGPIEVGRPPSSVQLGRHDPHPGRQRQPGGRGPG